VTAAAGGGPPYAALAAALATTPRATLVWVATARGSTPREPGAAMVVTADGAVGTIGGGRLEYEALSIAREALAAGAGASRKRFPLAASVGQCCGGVATLAFATFGADDRDWVAAVDATLASGVAVAVVHGLAPAAGRRMIVSATAVEGSLGNAALDATAIALARSQLAAADSGGAPAAVDRAADLPIVLHLPGTATFDVLLFGNGHVGRALAQVLRALPARVRWIDAREADFPAATAGNVEIVATDLPEAELRAGPTGAAVVVATHSHALDFDIVAAALARNDWSYLGMIGSQAKRAQLARRLAERGLPSDAIERVTCPIGAVAGLPRGKHPGTIAVAVAAEILARRECAAPLAAAPSRAAGA
jgi:xanthine dehydrogenase accessory factor